MSKKVQVNYDADTLKTTITVDGKSYDTTRIDGKEIADWAYPFMVRKVRWNGFYDEMVTALDGEKAFDLVFEGSEEALAELKEALEDAPVNVVSGELGNTITIIYDADSLTTEITVNGQTFDTTRIKGKEIEDWVYPFMMRKVKWDGIFDELKKALGTDEYDIQFSGTRNDMKILIEDCPETVKISYQKTNNNCQKNSDVEKIFKKANELYDSKDYTQAVNYYQKAADMGYAPAQCHLGECYDNGTGVNKDNSKAFEYYRRSAEQNDPVGMFRYAFCIFVGDYGEDDLDKCLEWMIKAADAGNEDAIKFLEDDTSETGDSEDATELENKAFQLVEEGKYYDAFQLRLKATELGNTLSMANLGWHYEYGNGVEQDYEKAFSYYKKSADMGNAWAQNKTGVFYNNGYGCEGNEAMAFSYFMKAAEQEESAAEYWVGMCYKNSWGVSEDYEKAYSWFLKAHKNGYVGGTRELAYCLWTGSGCAANKGRAKGLWNEAANKDDAQSACYLGDAHIEEGNNNKAFFYLNKAYKLGCMDAASNLSLCLEMGWGTQKNYRRAVEVLEKNLDEHPEYYVQLGKIFFPIGTGYQNYTKAAQYFQKAIDHEYVEGYFMLGMCYSEGYGVPKNKEKAKELLQVAADNGHTDAQEYLNDMSKKEGYIDTAKKIGKGALGLLGAFAQGYAQASSNMYYDDDE